MQTVCSSEEGTAEGMEKCLDIFLTFLSCQASPPLPSLRRAHLQQFKHQQASKGKKKMMPSTTNSKTTAARKTKTTISKTSPTTTEATTEANSPQRHKIQTAVEQQLLLPTSGEGSGVGGTTITKSPADMLFLLLEALYVPSPH